MATHAKPFTATPKRPVLDRRIHSRAPLTGCKATITVGLFSSLRGVNGKGIYPVVNISQGGVLLLGAKPLPTGQSVKIKMETESFIEPMNFRATVIWSAKVTGKKAYRIGLKLQKVDKDSLRKLGSLSHDLSFRSKKKNKDFK